MPIALMVVNTPTTDCIGRDPEIAAARCAHRARRLRAGLTVVKAGHA